MALSSQSLFLYNFQVTANNQNLQFQAVNSGPVLSAVIPLGYYSLGALLTQITSQMQAADTANTYTWTVDRTVSGGTQNRVSVSTSGSYLKILFGSGSLAVSSCAPLIGFNASDYSSATTYTGGTTAGTTLLTTFVGYNYLGPLLNQKLYGNVNVSVNGLKEAVVFQNQQFVDVEFRYEPKANALTNWSPLLIWMMQQRLFEFTPEISSPTTFYQVTLEKSQSDGKGLAFKMTEMLPQFPNIYKTGPMTFRVVAS